MTTKTKKQSKILAVVTYCIALIGVILALCLPMFNGKSMLVLTVPQIVKGIIPALNLSFGEAFPEVFKGYGIAIGNITLDFAEVATLLLAVAAVLGVIALIPVFASKKVKKTANVFAYIIEVLALIALGVLACLIIAAEGLAGVKNNIVIFAALAVVLLMLIIQSFGYKKGSGVMKLVMLLLSLVATLFVFDAQTYVAKIVNLDSIFSTVNSLIKTESSFLNGATGFEILNTPIANLGTGMVMVINICGIVAAGLTLVNLLFDIIGIASNSNKFTKIIALFRYGLVVIAAAFVIVMNYVDNANCSAGLYIYIVGVIALIQLIISLLSLAASKKKKGAVENVEVEPEYVEVVGEPVYAPAPVVEEVVPVAPVVAYEPSFNEPAPVVEAQPAPAVQTVNQTVVYNVTNIYNGPSDKFIETLTEDEKIEFSKIFLEKVNGSFANVPNYVVDGDNADFFAAIFIYLGKFRAMLSDGLMNKIYKQLSVAE